MSALFFYIVKLSIGMAAVYLFYRLLLQRLTFYRWNRFCLLVYPVCCFILPFIDVAPLLSAGYSTTGGIVEYIPSVQYYMVPVTAAPVTESRELINPWLFVTVLMGAGMLLLLCRLLLQWFSFLQIRRQAVLLSDDGVKLYGVNADIMPFSFANGIYLNPAMYKPQELEEIIRHEYVHVRQKHTIDILLGELLCILNWYNPFAWLLRHAIRQNLEFIADNTVLHSGVDKKAYQYLLLKVVGAAAFRVANQFNFSSLKKRIVMMNKIKSAKVHLLKFFFVLPLAVVLLLAFRNQFTAITAPAAVFTDTLPPVTSSLNDGAATGWDEKAFDSFKKRHPKVKSLRWANLDKVEGNIPGMAERFVPGPVLFVYFKHGKYDVYCLNSKQEVERFKKNYGELPPLAPPPPPAPPAAPMSPEGYPAAAVPAAPAAPSPYTSYAEVPAVPAYPNDAELPSPPAYPTPADAPVPEAYPAKATAERQAALEERKASLEQRQAALEERKSALEQRQTALEERKAKSQQAQAAIVPPTPIKLPEYIKRIHINNSQATVILKDGTAENYNLNNAAERKVFQKKYGKLVPPPPAGAAPAPAKGKPISANPYQWKPFPALPAPAKDGC